MGAFKEIVLAACVIGLVDRIISVLCGDKYKEQMQLITTLVLILAVGSSLSGKFTIPDISAFENEYESNEELAVAQYLQTAKLTISKSISDMLSSKGIEHSLVSIECSYDEYKYISIESIKVCTANTEKAEEIKSLLLQYYPNADIVVSE